MIQSAADYIKNMGAGLNVAACEFKNVLRSYKKTPGLYQSFFDRGFRHVRLRWGDDPEASTIDNIKVQTLHSLEAGLLPVVAYQAADFEQNADRPAADRFVAIWQDVIDAFSDQDNRVAFNLFVEIGAPLKDDPNLVNEAYARVIEKVREQSSDRLIFCSPVDLSSPRELPSLSLPVDDWVAVEAHFCAAGPCRTRPKASCAFDPLAANHDAQKQDLLDLIKLMADCDRPTWLGAIMPLPFNSPEFGEFTVTEAVSFVELIVGECKKFGIPHAWNADRKFIDLDTGEWIEDLKPVVDAILG